MHLVRAFGSSPSAYHDGMLGLELLARDRARSDDPESDDGRDPVRPPAEPPIHPFTGKFADPEHTVAYRSQAFRMMMPLHIVAMALMIVIELIFLAGVASTGNASDVVVAGVVTAYFVLGLGTRVAVHRWEDQAKAQSAGAMAWTLTVVLVSAAKTARPACSNVRAGTWVMASALFALVNATHGMEFWHTSLLIGLALCGLARARFLCGDLLALNLAIISLLVVHAFCHFQALLNRHAFLETDYLHASRERLEYDFKRLEAGLHRLSSKLPAVACEQAGGSVPSESSDSQGPRSTQSAPAAMVGGGERRPVPADGRRGERPSAMRCAGAAQSNAPSSADGHASRPPRRCSWSAETLAAAGTSSAHASAPAASSPPMGRIARRKMRRIRREWLADERARLGFALNTTLTLNPAAVRRNSPYI